jgi:3',5'-cyclic AMP phosphodiesterase CpdA
MRTIAHISDLHFGRHDPEVAEALLASIDRHRPNLVVLSGDLTQRARNHEFTAARAFIERIKAAKIVIPGNHDMPLFNVVARLRRPLARFERHLGPLLTPAQFYEDGELAVLGLNTARRLTGKNGRISHEQMSEIRQVFAARANGVFKVLATHHPLAIPSGGTSVDLAGRSNAAVAAIADAGVHLLLSGHYHRSTSGELAAELAANRSVLVVHAGTAISVRRRGGEANAYNLVQIDSDRLSIAVMEWVAPEGFREVRIARYVLMPDGHWRLPR